ncbi:glycerol-3-phosphate acyltransferase 3 isoform X2 [Stomoxys calcitrans]|uniref:Phospholipid/glycerol acyltransferase domain-containing protein n=1 Tax=Stomoxys calcitrans TaxID=35570 RepID=A0A1I8Q8N3_STOCA|nr:glycerol-3-phosphate acyltransferase 3 isoform X2 [Stomoxys calcitrans]
MFGLLGSLQVTIPQLFVNMFWISTSFFIVFLIILSAINKSVGFRRSYVNLLLRIFEYGRVSIETAHKERHGTIKDTDRGEETKSKTDIKPIIQTNDVHSAVNEPKEKSSCDVVSKTVKAVNANGNTLINRDNVLLPTPNETNFNKEKLTETIKDENISFHFEECLDYIKAGVEAIIEDEVTSRFEAEQLKSWNLLTRTNRQYEFINWKITLIWVVGFVVRYVILMPLRVLVCFLGVQWITLCTAVLGYMPEGERKRRLVDTVLKHCFSVMSSAISAVINYHNEENRPTTGICVANHTSPIDVLVLMCDSTYSLIGQRHGGFLGVLQRALARASPHIWFERGEAKDRHAVAERLRQHVSDPNNPPILIFPEGTCINNTSVMQFKKGSFEVGGVIYPVAIKYDPRFGDAFWNSSKYSMMQYLYMMMTSWAIVCDVWYLPPMYRQQGESAIDFANRVKSVIAKQGGLVDLVWDGQLKRMKPKKEWKEMQQVEFIKRLKGD